jgi:mRNA-degrading endonuclease toxin of MazEF toxin-antitoxin module
MRPIRQGDIVWALALDPQGANEKRRPFVILTLSNEIAEGGTVVGAAITATLPTPLTEDYVELPWHPNGTARTRLRKRCAVHCRWVVELDRNAIEQHGGHVSGGKLLEIMQRVKK